MVGSSEESSESAMSHDEEGSDVDSTTANEKEVRLEYKAFYDYRNRPCEEAKDDIGANIDQEETEESLQISPRS
jgi:hypothetical protein